MSEDQVRGFKGPIEFGTKFDTSSRTTGVKRVVAIEDAGENRNTVRCISFRETLKEDQHVYMLPRTTLIEPSGNVSEGNLEIIKIIQKKHGIMQHEAQVVSA